jgi:hypothetical protein
MSDDIEIEDVYKFIRRNKPEAYNPDLDLDKEWHEILVGWRCNRRYVIRVNSEYPTIAASLDDLDVVCPFCERPITEWSSVSKHSGGCFNATHGRRMSHE